MMELERRDDHAPLRVGERLGLATLAGTALWCVWSLSVTFIGPGIGGAVSTIASKATGTAAAAEYGAPNTPTHDAVVFAPTGDSLRILGSAFVGSLDDTHDSTAIQVDTAGGDFSSPQYFNDTIAGVITDTIPAIDSGAVVVTRIAYKGTNGDWSAWSDSLSTTMVFGLPLYTFEPDDWADSTAMFAESYINLDASDLDGNCIIGHVTDTITGGRPSGGTKAIERTLTIASTSVDCGVNITSFPGANVGDLGHGQKFWVDFEFANNSDFDRTSGDKFFFMIPSTDESRIWIDVPVSGGTEYMQWLNWSGFPAPAANDLRTGPATTPSDYSGTRWSDFQGNGWKMMQIMVQPQSSATSSDGYTSICVDDVLMLDYSAAADSVDFTSYGTAGAYFDFIALGRNVTINTSRGSMYYGRVRVWNSEPTDWAAGCIN